MTAKILLALDGSDPSMRAAQYVANLLEGRSNVSITLFHVLPLMSTPSVLVAGEQHVSPTLWEMEFKNRTALWEETKSTIEVQVFLPVREMFLHAGFSDEQIQTKFASGNDAADEILRECETGEHDTVVMGKRGLSRIRTFLTGSVTEKVVRHAKGHAVWVVE